MTLVDPMELLLALDPFLGERGEIKSIDDIDKITGFMEKADNLVGRCVYVNVLQATTLEDILAKFIEAGGWDLLNNWLQEAKAEDNNPFLLQLLNLYVQMPVSVSLLKSNNCAKTIKAFAKNDGSELKSVSGVIVEKWMKRIRDLREPDDGSRRKDGRRNRDRSKDKSEHRRDKERSKDKDRKKSKSRSDEKESRKSTDSKKTEKKEEERESIVIRVSKLGGVTKVSRPAPKTNESPKGEKAEALKRPHADSMSSGANLKNIKIPKLSNKDKMATNGPEKKDERRPGVLDQKDRPKTVKTYNSKFRSTGLEQAAPLPSKKKPEEKKDDKPTTLMGSKKLTPSSDDRSKSPSTSTSTSSSLATKKPLEKPASNKSSPSSSDGVRKGPSPSPQDPKKKAASPSPSPSPQGEKKRPAVVLASSATAARASSTDSNGSGSGTGPAPATSPTGTSAKPLPVKRAVSHEMHESSSFMDALIAPTAAPLKKKRKLVPQKLAKDVHNNKAEKAGETKKEDSSSSAATAPVTMETDHNDSNDSSKTEESSAASEPAAEQGTTVAAASANGLDKNGKKKKKVSWVDESKLRQFYFFDLDETERVNVNRMRDFGDMKKADMAMDREAMASAKRLARDKMQEAMQWRRPARVNLPDQSFVAGENSNEKHVQAKRELAVLQAIYFHKHMIPESPTEPMEVSMEVSNPRIIPVEEQSGGHNATPSQSTPSVHDSPNIVQATGLRPDVASLLSQLTGTGQSSPSITNADGPPTNKQLASLLASVTSQQQLTVPDSPSQLAAPSSPFQQGGAPAPDSGNIIGSIQNLLQNYQQSGGEGPGQDQLTEQLKQILQSTLLGQTQNGTPPADLMNNVMGGPMGMPVGPMGMPGGPMMGNDMPMGGPMGPMPPFPPNNPMFRGPMPQMPGGFGMGPPRGMYGEYDDRGPPPPNWHRDRGPPRGDRHHPRDRPRGGDRGRDRRQICWHFKNGKSCTYGQGCTFLHPGVNGPKL